MSTVYGIKKHKVLAHLKSLSSDVVFLQALHFKKGEFEYLKRDWVGEAYDATYRSNSRGVGILINKTIPFSLISLHKDQDGRFLVLTCTLYGERYTLRALYVPSGANLILLDKIQNILDNTQTGTIILGGDLNHTFDKLDQHSFKKGSFKDPPKRLKKFISSNNLEDAWRLLFPTTKDYTYSQSKKSYSRIDYIFISRSALNNILGSEIHEIVISDHSPVSCYVVPTENRQSD